LWIFVVAALLFSGCGFVNIVVGSNQNTVRGSGKIATETRTVSNFNQVSLLGSGDLTIQSGEHESLTIEAEDNILPLIRSEVKGSRLELGFKPNTSVDHSRPIHFTLVVKNLTAVTLEGSGNVTNSSLNTDHLDLSILGSGNMRFENLKAQALKLDLVGSGNVDVAGEVQSQQVSIPGSGSYRANDLNSQTAQVSILGSGEANLWAEKSLDIEIAGSGSVKYYGSPQVTQKITGSGNVRSLGNH
jgi:hypothetical protein